MKKNTIIYFFMVLFVGIAGTSCKKYLDINKNPNQPTASTPQLLIPQAITATANSLNGYNTYGAQSGMYMANAGGYGGFGSNVTYNYSVTDYNGLWGLYDVNEDFYLAKSLSTDSSLTYYNAISRIMLAHNFELLVDTYNSIPYFDALQGNRNTTPKFDDPALVYADLAKQLDTAIALINEGQAAPVTPSTVTNAQDPLFSGNMNRWKKFANTLKLRLLITGDGKAQFSNTTFDPAGFLTDDALINPGYTRDNGKQNPKWNTWAYDYTGSDGNKAWMPSTFILAFYNGKKLSDDGRGYAIYYQFPSTPTNRLGFENNNNVKPSPAGSFWYPSSNRTGSSAGNATGVLKGPNASMPILTAAESYFLQAEAAVRGIITSNADSLFRLGIKSSFHYLYELPDGTINTDISGDPAADFQSYLDDNSDSYLVNFSLATTTAQKIEAIITQKFIALNMVNSNQAWNDYRRTHYPVIVSSAGATGDQTFASTQSQSTRTDKLPTRIAYPSAEISSNPNTPNGINPLSSLIFWAMP
jgi:hypothetical protein